jgi:DNA repair protein RadC
MRERRLGCNAIRAYPLARVTKIAEKTIIRKRIARMADGADKDGHHGVGHRSRLRKRLFEQRGESLHDHEIVEYLLALAIPRRDTKQIAKELLAKYGGLSALITADPERIAQEKWMGETSVAVLKIVQIAALRLLSEPVREQPVLASWQALLDYLRADMAHLTIERVRTLYLNSKNILIRDEVASEGSVDQAAIYTREVVRRAMDLGAAAIILVHNHPSGDSAPSHQDIAMTRDIIHAAKAFNIAVHDHIIIGKDGFSSMRSAGLI